ncbi:MAG: 16S rRNA (adenine(1518)-N(6)/adenine(1519)-N(6))-dimethyltransferase RsmA [Muribaculaceae bacterium]|nr:16S rRNA (adenine(1518)-N(6)/adenine(1519)-N(6))-dimethyltransferase RsmA [Muribaculaceae bacterium]
MASVRPKKALGQHFLTDRGVAARIAATLDAVPSLPVLEVGPGTGVLTQFMLDAGRDLRVVEIDTESVDWLRTHFPALEGRIIEGDFLQLPLDTIFDGKPMALIGNYPYNISSQIFFHMLDYRDMVPFCSGMLQREVAERLAAPAGTKARGILSVLLQLWYDVRYLFTVPPGVFNPPPKVHSGVVELRRNGRSSLPCPEALLKTVVKTTFGQRRKTIRNSLRGLLPPGSAMPETPLLAMRPEQLSVDQFIELALGLENLRAQ